MEGNHPHKTWSRHPRHLMAGIYSEFHLTGISVFYWQMTNSKKCQVLMRSLQIIVSNYAMWDVAHVENNSWNGPDRIYQGACATAHLLRKIHPFKDFGGNIQFNPACLSPPYDSDLVKCTVCHGPLSWQLTPSIRGLGTLSRHTGAPSNADCQQR